MSLPNYFEDVKAAKAKYPEAWKQAHTGSPQTEDFIKLLAKDLHAKDVKVALNGKRGNPLDLSDDALNILCDKDDSKGRTPEGLPCVVVDVIGGAGGPNPVPAWGVMNTLIEGSGAHVDPSGTPIPPVPTMPDYEALGGDAYWRAEIGVPLQADMTQATSAHGGGPLNDGSSVWFARPIFRILHAYANGQTPDRAAIIKSVRNEWRAVLTAQGATGLPPL